MVYSISVSIKYFFMFCTFLYVFKKLCRIKLFNKRLSDFFAGIFLACIICLLPDGVNFLSPLAFLFLAITYIFIRYRFGLYETITVSLLSSGITYLSLFISLFICAPFGYICFSVITNSSISRILSFLLAGIFQFITVLLLFRIKKLRSSLSPKKNSFSYEILVIASIITIFMASLCTIQPISVNILFVFFVFACTCSIFVYIFWKRHIEFVYNKNVVQRNTIIMEQRINELEQMNIEIKKENQDLAKIIHRDNKIIPAMEKLVRDIALANPSKEINELLAHLEELSSERKGIIKDHQIAFSSLPKTDNISVNAVIQFLKNLAEKGKSEFSFTQKGLISRLLSNCISAADLVALISDIGENALIAVRSIEHPKVHLSINTEISFPVLEFLDNGEYFDCSVLANLGKTRITTHKDDGGSGIGLMYVFEILQKTSASLIIDESYILPYTKSVRIVFDGNGSIKIITGRKEVFDACKMREDIVIQNI